MTRHVALIGQPLRRRHSQVMHDAAFAAAGIDARYELRELEEAELPDFVARARDPDWFGLQVTAPYKRTVMPLLDELEADARAIDAVNSVLTRDGRLIGFNTDAPGFRLAAERLLGDAFSGISAAVLGAGGVAHAVAYALLDGGAARVTVANRHAARAASLVAHFGDARLEARPLDEVDDRLGAADLVVNATTVGMLSGGSAVAVERLGAATAVFDCVYVPAETELVRGARARGLRAANGDEMLVAQAAIAFERWTGIGGMEATMRAAVQPLFDDPSTQA
ncbi:MAG: shikimate dehydrogenase [Chloroflexota bacterium]